MHILSLLCLCLVFIHADAHYMHGQLHCHGSSSDGHDAFVLESTYYNKMLYLQYNSTVGKVIANTEVARKVADILNTDFYLSGLKETLELCKAWITRAYDRLAQTVEPKVRLRLEKAAADSDHLASLVCSVYNFYPKDIVVTWLKNGEQVTSEVTSTESLPNGNWLYQKHSRLEYTPTHGDTISCVVEHASFQKPRIYEWEPMPESVRNKIILGTMGLIMGVVSFSAGLIYYRRNVPGQERVLTSGDRRDVQSGEADTHLHQEE